MTDAPAGTRPRPSLPRRAAHAVTAAGLVAASCALAGSSLAPDDAGWAAPPATPPTTVATPPRPPPTAPPTTAPVTTAPPAPAPAADPATLPVPERAPAEPYAPTPEVVLGTIALPSIGVSAPLGEGVTLTALDRSPGHWPGTALPGEPGNVVVAGHRVTHSRPFHDLDRLRAGDTLVFTMQDGTVSTYELTRTEIVAPDALSIVDQTPARTATLFACHPKGSAAQRIVARFRLADEAPATARPG